MSIPATAANTWTSAEIALITTKDIASISLDQIKLLSKTQIPLFSIPQIRAFLPAQIKILSEAQIVSLTTEQVYYMTVPLIQALTPDQFASFKPQQVAGFTKSQIPYFTAAQIGRLDASALATLNYKQLACFSPLLFSAFDSKAVSGFSALQVSSFNEGQIKSLKEGTWQLSNLNASAFAGFSAIQIGWFETMLNFESASKNGYLNLTTDQIGKFNKAAVGALTDKDLNYFTRSQLKSLGVGLTTPQYSYLIKNGHISDLSAVNVSLIPSDIIGSLSSDQAAQLNSDQIAALKNTQFSGMTNLQIQSLDASGLTQTQFVYRDASGKTILSELTALQISTLSTKQIGFLSLIQIQSLSNDQVSGLTLSQLISSDASGIALYSDLTTSQKNSVIASLKQTNKTPYSSVLTILKTIESQISSAGLTDAQIQNLKDLSSAITSVYGKDSYIGSILNSMINGDPAGHAGLSVNMTLNSYDAALNKWFLGTDNPTLIQGDHYVAKTNPLFSTSATSTQMGSVISQGKYNGDCWLVAAIAATATVNPDLIKSMISDNGNGTYAVRFYNARTNTMGWVTVDNQLPSYSGVSDSDGTIWGGLIEKAYIVAQSNGIATYKAGVDHNSYIDNQIGWGQGLTAITGMKMGTLTVDNTALAKYSAGGSGYTAIKQALSKHETVLFDSQTKTNYGLVEKHMFEVIGIDQSNDHFIFQNPWGPNSHCSPFEVSSQQLADLWQANDHFLLGNYAGPGASNYNLGNTTAQADPSPSLAASFFANQNSSLMG